LIGQWLSDRLGQTFVIDNRVGAGGNIGTEVALRAPPDGYTLLICNAANVINSALYDKLNFDFMRDIAPVASLMRSTLVLEVNISFPAKTVPEFIAYAKGNPRKINFASPGKGTPLHLAGELFKMMTGTDMVHVPYRGDAPALTDLMAGQVQVMFASMLASIEYIKAGRLRALAVTTASRSEALPTVPTVGDFVPSYEASGWFGVVAPKNTPTEVIARLNSEINAGLADPKLRARLTDLGGTMLPGSTADFGKFIADETEKWGKVIKFAGIKPE
jgi:tripartite-type tricarboxylate transporter receptor subunit TctC